MKRLYPVLLSLLILASAACTGRAQDSGISPELALLQVLDGDFTYEYESGGQTSSGTLSFRTFADGQFVTWDEWWTPIGGEPVNILGWLGYDAERGAYVWRRIFSNGYHDTAEGWLKDGTISFVLTDWKRTEDGSEAPGIIVRTKWVGVAPEGWTFLWEASTPEGEWELGSTGRVTPAM